LKNKIYRKEEGFLMKNIILQIVAEAAKKFLEYYEGSGIHALHEMTEEFKQISEGMARDILSAFIEDADKSIRDARHERMGDGIKIRQSGVPRELFTALGSFSYNRTYFDTPEGRMYLLDDILGVESYERIDSGVSAGLVNAAARNSYGRSSDIITDGRISRQSVRNKAMNTGEVVHMPEKAADTPETLHIFADEDHVNLQNGKNTILPLVTICAGKASVSKGRNALIEPFHMHGYGVKSEDFWEYVYALCAERYDMRRVKRIYIYGDGGKWIQGGFDVFPEAVHILDEFHLTKRLRSLLSGEISAPFGLSARSAIARNDRPGFDRAVQNILSAIEEKTLAGKERNSKMKKAKENAAYILKHWGAIQNLRLPDSIGSCTEAMVSHVLSERFSRNPMGWSEAGLAKMAMIRVFVVNGGKVAPVDVVAGKQRDGQHTVITGFEKYQEIVRRQRDEVLKDAKNWRWFETENLVSDKRTGTRVAVDALARTRNVS
jgi:hypothetical protein